MIVYALCIPATRCANGFLCKAAILLSAVQFTVLIRRALAVSSTFTAVPMSANSTLAHFIAITDIADSFLGFAASA